MLRFNNIVGENDIPAGSVIESAELEVYISTFVYGGTAPTVDMPIGIYGLKDTVTGMNFGTSTNAAPQTGTVCWRYIANDTKKWSGDTTDGPVAGADFNDNANEFSQFLLTPSMVNTAESGTTTVRIPLPINVVQSWVNDQTNNNGIIIKPTTQTNSSQYYDISSSNDAASRRPKLIITYKSDDIEPTASVQPTATPTPTTSAESTATATPTPATSAQPTATPTPATSAQPTVTSSAPVPAFSDFKGFEWAQQYINRLAAAGIVGGYPDGTFRPGNNITRAEFAKMLTGAYEIIDETATTTFKDVKKGDWFYKYVASAQKEGLVIGNGDGTCSPNAEMTREEMFAINARAMNKYLNKEILGNNDEETTTLLANYIDRKLLSNWAKGFAATNVKYGVVIGSPIDGFYMALNPAKAITRGEVAVILGRAMNAEEQ